MVIKRCNNSYPEKEKKKKEKRKKMAKGKFYWRKFYCYLLKFELLEAVIFTFTFRLNSKIGQCELNKLEKQKNVCNLLKSGKII